MSVDRMGRLRTVVVLVAVLMGFASLATSCSSDPTSSPRPAHIQALASVAPAVARGTTPPGFLPVDFGDAQISVPADWGLVSDGESACLQAPGAVILGNGSWCPPTVADAGSPSPLTVSIRTIEPRPTDEYGPPSRVVHGIPVYAPGLAPLYEIPRLHISLFFTGDVPPEVLASLTYSPRAVVLAPEGPTAVPPGWRPVRFAGLKFVVPPSWTVRRQTSIYSCGGSSTVGNEVVLVSGPPSSASCPMRLPDLRSVQGVPGVEIDSYGPGVAERPAGCPGSQSQRGLTVCIDTGAAGSTLEADVWGPSGMATFILGLTGDGLVARTVFHSLRR
jgi:hypothetical protein